uniref:Translation initiation factor 1 n=2 Tax=Salix TaxID=40685 RepID=A0A7H1JFV2_9ROSI|nr:translation initiation factor 1 [Salix pentandra]UEC44873.1 translation initiation factor 1 [Salix alba]
MVLNYASEKARGDFIRIPSGDRVKIEVSAYNSTRKRLISRLPNKNSND